jgi:hypothetical protein
MTAKFRPNIKSAILHKPYRKADLAQRIREILDLK